MRLLQNVMVHNLQSIGNQLKTNLSLKMENLLTIQLKPVNPT
jgi:hypothetical protein